MTATRLPPPAGRVVRILTEYGGAGGSTRAAVLLASAVAATYGQRVEIHYHRRSRWDDFLARLAHRPERGASADAPGAVTLHPYRSLTEAVAALRAGGEGTALVAHLPFDGRRVLIEELRRAAERFVLWNMEIPARHSYRGTIPNGVTVVYLVAEQLAEMALGPASRAVRLPTLFEPILRADRDAPARTIGMLSALPAAKGVPEGLAAFRLSRAARLNLWTHAPFLVRLCYRLADRLVRVRAPETDQGRIYSSFDCLLHLPQHTMGDSLTVRDSLALGTPCVLSDLPGYRRFADLPGVTLVERSDARAVAAALDRTLENEPTLRPRLRETFRPRLPDNAAILAGWAELLGLPSLASPEREARP